MQQKLSRVATAIRVLIWGTLIIQLVYITMSAVCANDDEPAITQDCWVPGGLWPGDWVPHPNLPEPKPESNDAVIELEEEWSNNS